MKPKEMKRKQRAALEAAACRYGLSELILLQLEPQAGYQICIQYRLVGCRIRIATVGAIPVKDWVSKRMLWARIKDFTPLMGQIVVDVIDGIAIIIYYRTIPEGFGYCNADIAFEEFVNELLTVTRQIIDKLEQQALTKKEVWINDRKTRRRT